MSSRPDPVKREQWTERLQRFARSGQTIAQFCAAERVSVPSFYQWKRKLGYVVDQRPSAARRKAGQRRSANLKAPAFKPVWIAPPLQAGVTIRLPGGIVLELGSDLHAVEQVVAQLLDRQASREADAC